MLSVMAEGASKAGIAAGSSTPRARSRSMSAASCGSSMPV